MSGDRPDRRADARRATPDARTTPDATTDTTRDADADDVPRPGAGVERPVAARLGRTAPAEVAKAALNRARAGAEARGLRPGQPLRRRRPVTEVRMSSAGRDGRDPMLVGDTLDRLAAERGWSAELSVGGVIGRWADIVGTEVAQHCTPETFDDGRLVVRAHTTAWATQMRLLAPQLLARLERELGPGVVREVGVLNPTNATWSKGRRRVQGRGPRDTYG